jgi:hypothetical protein
MRSAQTIRFSLAKEPLSLLEASTAPGESIHVAAKRIVKESLFLNSQSQKLSELEARIAALEVAIGQLQASNP